MNEALIKEYAKTFTEKVAVIHSTFDEKPTTVAFGCVGTKQQLYGCGIHWVGAGR